MLLHDIIPKRQRSYYIIALFYVSFFIIFSCSKDDERPGKLETYKDYSFEEPAVTGNTFYIDPVNGSPEGDGSQANPWRTLQEVVEDNLITFYVPVDREDVNSPLEIENENAPVKGGDRLVLKSGYHGYVKRNTFIFREWLTIEGEEGARAVLSQFRMEGAFAKIFLNNITVIKESYVGEENYWEADAINRNSDACVYLRSDNFWGKGSDIKMKNLVLMTRENTGDWTAGDWVEKSASGINIRSVPNVEIFGCMIKNISFGISVSENSENCKVVNNVIQNYSGDGARVLSDDVFFAYNVITDCYKVDDNHDDAIQSYSIGENGRPGQGIVKDVILRGNLIIGTTNFDNPLAGSPQGIGCFDGFFENWIVENNVVIVDHYHGISFYGMRRSYIVHNTVIDQNPDNTISPWIMITDHKNTIPSSNCMVANNIVSSSVSAAGDKVFEENNYALGKANYNEIFELFVDPINFDFHLLSNDKTNECIIDKGQVFSRLISSEIDKDNTERDAVPDLGAYEFMP